MTANRFSIPSHVAARQVGEELVILDLRSGTYHGLNPVGTAIWQQIAAGASLDDALAKLEADYEVAPDVLRQDVEALLAELVGAGLLQRT